MLYQRFLISIVLFCSVLAASAQQRFNPQAFDCDLINYVVRHANLTPEETKRFVPLYKEMKAKKRDIHDELRQLKHQQTASERVARSLISRCDNLEVRMKQVDKDYHQRMLKVLSAVKLKAVIDAERQYHRLVFRKAAKRGR